MPKDVLKDLIQLLRNVVGFWFGQHRWIVLSIRAAFIEAWIFCLQARDCGGKIIVLLTREEIRMRTNWFCGVGYREEKKYTVKVSTEYAGAC
jgi:hypothetical protein